jgi:hypothetical protein
MRIISISKQHLTWLLCLMVLVLVAGRLYLPHWLKGYVNNQIAELENYEGGIEDIDLYLWRGAYQIDGMVIYKKGESLEKPFVAAGEIDLSVEWSALLKGVVVAEIDFHDADLNFSLSQTGEGEGWVKFVNALSPFEINRLEIHSGRLTYTSPAEVSDTPLFIDNINARIMNLRHVSDKNEELPSPINITGTSIGEGNIEVTGKMDILRDVPDFDLTLSLREADLTAFNDYTRSFMALDFESGSIDVFMEMAASDGQVAGYIKPVATDIHVVNIRQDTNPLNYLWESVASSFIGVFKNHPEDQFALRVPLTGDLKNPDKDMWSAFFSIFSNAFGEAFTRNPDGTIEFQDNMQEEVD